LLANLQELLERLPSDLWVAPPPKTAVAITGISLDSRSTRAGELFCAVPGRQTDGSRFCQQAWARGAAAVLAAGDAALGEARGPVLRAAHVRRALALLADAFYGHPSRALALIGITGTDGKTSTAWFLQHLLTRANRPAVALGTLGVRSAEGTLRAWSRRVLPAADGDPASSWAPTTPEAPEFQATLAALRDAGVPAAVAEVSSHALAQERTYGTRFAAVALTQLGTDHLDYHRCADAYRAAKARLFDPAARGDAPATPPPVAVVNLDDPFGRTLAARLPDAVGYGRAPEARVRLIAAAVTAAGITLDLDFAGTAHRLEAPLLGAFHVQNLHCAAAVAFALGLAPADIARAAESLSGVPGRFEALATDRPLSLIVDYAHTAAALEKALTAARELRPGRLTVVFGCGGDRDRAKREPMGAIAGRLADRVIVTTDNPRSEDPEAIASDILRGVARSGTPREMILDRRRAIARALATAEPEEVVLLAGRGAETRQVFAQRSERFDDRDVARRLLRRRPIAQRMPGPGEDPWCLSAIARLMQATVAGVSPEDWRRVSRLPAAGVVLDSRSVVGGEIFVALPGSRSDGHEYVARALEAGASAAVVRRAWWSRRKAARARGIHLLVEDPLEALQEWAAGLRLVVAPRVIAITGSSGKTTTKELLRELLHPAGSVVGTLGNRNNEIGLPWTLLQLRQGDACAVVELGANHPGEISQLTRICRPDVALITCIGRAHMGPFGGIDELRAAKLEILEGLAPEGTVVIPDHDARLAAEIGRRWSGRVLRFGRTAAADVRAVAIAADIDGTCVQLADREEPLHLQLLGPAAATAALAAIAGARALDLAPVDPGRLSGVPPLPGRLDPRRHSDILWLLDMYNASPESTLHALGFLREAPAPGRRVLLFGGMRELGPASGAIHAEVGAQAGFCEAGVFFGPEARLAAGPAQRAGMRQVLWCEEVGEAVRFLEEYLRPGDIVLVKGARASGLEAVVRAAGVIDAAYGEERP